MILIQMFLFSIIIGCIKVAGIPTNSSCPAGFGGDLCLDINCKSGNPCYNNGECKNGSPKDFCSCTAGWTGPQCGLPSCEKMKCPVGISCKLVKEVAVCVCDIEDSKGISHQIVGCMQQDVYTNGKCAYNSTGNEICFCKEGYLGHKCEYQLCANQNFCENNGKCISFNGDMECECPSGTDGKHCKKCSLNCHHGECKFDLKNDNYFCQCESGFTGQLCEIGSPTVLPDCGKTFCNGNGDCATIGNNKCICNEEYMGKKCENKCSEVCDSKKCNIDNGASVCSADVQVKTATYSQQSLAIGVGIFFILFVILCGIIGAIIYRNEWSS